MITPKRIALYVAALAVAACAPPGPSQADMEADVAAINAVRELEVASINAGEADLGYLASDAVIMPPNEPASAGIDAAQAWFSAFMEQFDIEVEYTNTEITVSGDWAIEHYTGSATFTPTGGGDSVTEPLKGIHTYRREADGSWKMVHDVWNSDAPAPEM